jgi:hypothetical protein
MAEVKSKPKRLIVLEAGIGRSIKGKSITEIVTQAQLLSVPIDGGVPTTLLEGRESLVLPDGVVYHQGLQRLFISSMGTPWLRDGSIISTQLDGTDLRVVLPKGQVHTAKQLALDAVADKLYIADREGMRILRCNPDGSDIETVHSAGIVAETPGQTPDATGFCVGMAVSSASNMMYWTQKGPSKGNQGRIFCAPIPASGEVARPVCLLDRLPEPVDLYMDDESKTLYWTDRGELPFGNTLNRVQLDVTGAALAVQTADPKTGFRHEIMVQNLDEAIGLARDDDTGRWYVSDMGGTIWSFDSEGTDRQVVLQDKSLTFTGMILIDY